jgi:hypothetical protein
MPSSRWVRVATAMEKVTAMTATTAAATAFAPAPPGLT